MKILSSSGASRCIQQLKIQISIHNGLMKSKSEIQNEVTDEQHQEQAVKE